jgi:ABC-type sugar transport system ATPase subunit
LDTLLKLEGITKRFPGVTALADVNLEIKKGQIVGLVGENGAGKSTLIKVIGGAYRPDEGCIRFKGRDVDYATPNNALQDGIGVVYQELSLCENLSIAENIGTRYLKDVSGRFVLKWVDRISQESTSRELLSRFDIDLNPQTKVRALSLAQRELVEIMRAVAMEPELLILDEPTGPLSWILVEKLFDILSELRDNGTTILYISHEISEVIDLCDRVIVLRDGFLVADLEPGEMEEKRIADTMVGRELGTMFPEKGRNISDNPILEVTGFDHPDYFHDVSFSLRCGEILGISGLIGAGRTELALALFGMIRPNAGSIVLDGNELFIRSPNQALEHGIGYLTEDRKKLGLFLNFSILENFLSIKPERFSRFHLVRLPMVRDAIKKYVEKFSIKAGDIRDKVLNLSGGNQQKVLISKVVSLSPRILIVDEPTRGVDIGAKKSIHESIRRMADSGTAVMMISSEMTEIIGMSDRIMIMDSGKVVETLVNDGSVTQEKIMNAIVNFKSKERTYA